MPAEYTAHQPLHGVTVIECASFVAVPSAGLALSHLGADVIRVDPPGGASDINRWPLAPTGPSLFWAGLNKSKRSVVIDVRKPEGRELLLELATRPGPGGGVLRGQPRRIPPSDVSGAVGSPIRRHPCAGRGPSRRVAGRRLHDQRGGRGAAHDRPPGERRAREPRRAGLGPGHGGADGDGGRPRRCSGAPGGERVRRSLSRWPT